MSLVGTQLGNYQLLRSIGSGGMGEVYLAEDTRIHRQVAIKVIREEVTPYPDPSATNEAARLFQREMKAIAQLDHPHILPLFDFGEETINRTTLTYMVIPFRQEGSLADWLQKRSSAQLLSTQDVARFVSQAADALQHAHDHQLIHQDVKPSNFLIRSRSGHPNHPDLLLADFGIAKVTTATATASQSIRGTPTYMAPEQWDGQPVAATDQYALAVMAYQLLTGRPPFLGGPGQVMRQHFQAQPQPPSTLNPRIPSTLDAVILCALAKQPEARFTSIAEFARAFQQAVQDAPTAAVSSAPPSSLVKERPGPSTRDSDIRATLAISQAEALNGTSRTLTLPGGRQVTVPIPGGARDGQVVRLEGQGEAPPDGGEAGALVLTILVAAAQEVARFSPANAPEAEETLLTADPTVLATSAPTVSDTSHLPTVSPTAHAESSLPTRTEVSQTQTPPSPPTMHPSEAPKSHDGDSRRSIAFPSRTLPPLPLPPTRTPLVSSRGKTSAGKRGLVLLMVGLLLVMGSGIGLFYIVQANKSAGTVGTATATFSAANPNPYPPHHGILVINDQLNTSNDGLAWDENQNCYFTGGAYHVHARGGAGEGNECLARASDLSNFVYQVQMKFVKGHVGEWNATSLLFRVTPTQFWPNYEFKVFISGSYTFRACAPSARCNDLIPGANSNSGVFACCLKAFKPGLNQPNLIAIVSDNDTFDIYVNGVHAVGPIHDITVIHGQIGFYIETGGTTADSEVEYSNLKVWQL